MDEKQLAQAALAFLQRSQMSGNEVPTYMAVIQWLEAKAKPTEPPAENPPEAAPQG